MTVTNFRNIWRPVVLVAALTLAGQAATFAAPRAEMKPDGTVVIGNSTRVLLGQSGVIRIVRDNGDLHEINIPLTRIADGKWFGTMSLDNRKTVTDTAAQTQTFTGTFTAPGQAAPIPVEISTSAREAGTVRVTVTYKTDVPIAQILSSYYVLFQSARAQHAGQEISIGTRKIALTTDVPSANGGSMLHNGRELQPVTYFANDGRRRLVVTPVEAASMVVSDNNRPPQPLVIERLFPRDNRVVFDLSFGEESKPASPETYFGVDYVAQNNFRLPQYALSRNLVQNSGFEAGLHGWRRGIRGNTTAERFEDHYTVVTDNVHAGRRSLKIQGEKGQSPAQLTSFAIPVETGATYTISFYARAEREGMSLNFSSVTGHWPVFVSRSFKLDTTWKRYDYTFTAPNEMINLGFGIPNPNEDGVAWLDDIQFEKGPLTEYTEKAVNAALVTERRGNWLQPGEKVNARLELAGTASTSGSIAYKVTDFFGTEVLKDTRPFALDKQGVSSIPLPMEGLQRGVYLLETNIRAGDFSNRDFFRVTIAPFADNTARHKNLFAYGGEGPQPGGWKRRFDFFKRAGIGSGVVFDPPPHQFLDVMQKQGITDVSSIFKAGKFAAGGKNLKENFRLTEAELKLVEEEAYALASGWPMVRHWKLINEPGSRMTDNLEAMRSFVQTQVAAYRGIKRANPNAIVFSPDPANMAPQHGIRWIDMFLEAGGKAAFDVVAIHPYRLRPEEPDTDSDTALLISTLKKRGYNGEIWWTEGGGNFYMNLPAWGVDVHRALSQEEGASLGWRVGALTYDLGYGEKMGAAYAMRYWLVGLKYSDHIKQQVSWYFPQNSTLDYDLTPGAEIFSSNTLVDLLGDSRFKQDIELGEGTRGYLFEDGRRRPVAALWSHDIRVDKGNTPGPLLDISSLPADVEIINFTGASVPRTETLRLSSFPVFLRGAAGSTDTLSAILSALPLTSTSTRQLVPFIKVTGAQTAELALRNLLSRPVRGRVQVTQADKVIHDNEITVAGRETWTAPVNIAREAARLQENKIRVNFQPEGMGQPQISDLSMETLAIPRIEAPPRIDGDFKDWPAGTKLRLPRRLITFGKDKPAHKSDADLSGTFYSAWDADYLYLGFEINDDQFSPSTDPTAIWTGDGVQIYFDSFQNAGAATKPSFDSDDQNFDIWPGPDGAKLRRVVTPDVQLAFLKPGWVDSARSSFQRTQSGYNLEVAIPKAELAPIDFKAGSSFGFSFIINDRDDAIVGRSRGLTLTPEGTEPFNHPELFTTVVLQP